MPEESTKNCRDNFHAQLVLYRELLQTAERQHGLIIEDQINESIKLVENRERIINKIKKLVNSPAKTGENPGEEKPESLKKEIDNVIKKIMETDRENKKLMQEYLNLLRKKMKDLAGGKKLLGAYGPEKKGIDSIFIDKKK